MYKRQPKGYGRVDFEGLARVLSVRAETRVVIEIKTNFIAHAEAQTLADAQAFAEAVNGVQA